jgi:predicted DNA-binding protein (MmcQ/YjbR family)
VEDAGNTVCFLSLHKKHVSLGFSQASELEDPARLLQGTGKHQRHVKLKSLAEVNCPELRALLTQAWDRQPEPAALQAALEKVRELCLAMPKTSEKLSHGHPTFYVGKRAFAVYGLYSPSLAVKPSASRGFDLADDPRFFPTPYMAKNGWWSLRLEEPIEWEQVRELLEESYREFKKA